MVSLEGSTLALAAAGTISSSAFFAAGAASSGGASADAALLELLGGAGDGMAARVEAFRGALQLAEGTHSFHNFTSSNLLRKLNKKLESKSKEKNMTDG